MELMPILLGLVIGAVIAALLAFIFRKNNFVSKNLFDKAIEQQTQSNIQAEILQEKLKSLELSNSDWREKALESEREKYNLNTAFSISKEQLKTAQEKNNELAESLSEATYRALKAEELHQSLSRDYTKIELKNQNFELQINRITEELKQKAQSQNELQNEVGKLNKELSQISAQKDNLSELLNVQKKEVEELQKTAHLQFEKIANKILEEKSERFTSVNKVNMEQLLSPLKEDIHKFKEKVESTHHEETKQRTSLEERIKGLIEQTNKISSEANNLASALKGQSQKRGQWGEVILEKILEASGLTKDREYHIQHSVKTADGKAQRLDVTVNLPDHRTIIIDSKVSLIAYDQYSASSEMHLQKRFLNDHINAVKLHIDQLSLKRYDDIDTTLDFIMMFVPIEPAYLLAIQGDPDLWSYAYSKRILLVSPTTLIACLKLFSDLWRREWQNKNAMEIVKRGELMYEKLVGFVDNYEEIGRKLSAVQTAYDNALGQLKSGKGNVINQAIQLKNLGLKSNKKIPESMISHEFLSDADNDV